MENRKETTETFVKHEAYTESDAVHPRFIKQNPEDILKYEKENYYFCKQCNQFFAPTFPGLVTHFNNEIRRHKPCGSCLYCKGKVYEYSLNRELKVYHNCRDTINMSSSNS